MSSSNTQEVNGHSQSQVVQEVSENMTTSTENLDAQETEQDASVALTTSGSALGSRPVTPNDMDIAGTMTFSGVRPIMASTLEVWGTMMGGRPIEASHLAVVDTDTIPGHRPIFASDLAVIEADTLPGHRPIAASPAYLMQSSTLPGGRPIASNQIDDPISLMGYID